MNIDECYREISELAARVVSECAEGGVKISAAESCTGGLISGAVTAVSGSSAVIELGVCSYSNRVKRDVLGVSEATLERFSEYSVQCAAEMAEGVRRLSGADYGVSTTGVAGPTGGSAEHPVGEVCIAVSGGARGTRSERFLFRGSREQVRAEAVRTALKLLLEEIERR